MSDTIKIIAIIGGSFGVSLAFLGIMDYINDNTNDANRQKALVNHTIMQNAIMQHTIVQNAINETAAKPRSRSNSNIRYTGPYQCTICSLTFNNKNDYMQHLHKESRIGLNQNESSENILNPENYLKRLLDMFTVPTENENEVSTTVAKPRSQSNSDNLTQLSQPDKCDKCNLTFNNLTDFINHFLEHEKYNRLGIVQLTSAKKNIKYAPWQVQFLEDPNKKYIVHNIDSLLERKGGIRKRKRTHKKQRRLHNRSHKR